MKKPPAKGRTTFPAIRRMDALNIAVITVSDSRTAANDSSGDYLCQALNEAGHRLAERHLIADDVYLIRKVLSALIYDPEVHAVLITGGTGFSGRDTTPEAVQPLFDKRIDGFGELFRALSHQEIGSSTIQSRALAGWANRTVIFCLPGSTGACRTGWQGIVREQLEAAHKPCNFVATLRSE